MARQNEDIRQQMWQTRRAMGEFLAPFPWDHVCTLTFREPCGSDAAQHHFLRFVRQLATLAGNPIYWFWVIEQPWSDHAHLHALLQGTNGVPIAALDGKWRERHGNTKILRYDRVRGAAYYVTKTTASAEAIWDFRLPVHPDIPTAYVAGTSRPAPRT